MIEPPDYPKMMLTLAIQDERIASIGGQTRPGRATAARCDQMLEVLARLWDCPVHEFWHDVMDAAGGGLPAPLEAERLLATLRER